MSDSTATQVRKAVLVREERVRNFALALFDSNDMSIKWRFDKKKTKKLTYLKESSGVRDLFAPLRYCRQPDCNQQTLKVLLTCRWNSGDGCQSLLRPSPASRHSGSPEEVKRTLATYASPPRGIRRQISLSKGVLSHFSDFFNKVVILGTDFEYA